MSIAPGKSGRRGFTLTELLVVIAIIAILAAIIFPVMVSVRTNMMKQQCMGNMRQLAEGLTLYKEDRGVYPEALYGFSQSGVDQFFLYPQYIRDRASFHCPRHPLERNDNTRGGGMLMPSGTDSAQPCSGGAAPCDRQYFWFDSYDGGFVPRGSTTYEVHYRREWTPGVANPGDSLRQLRYRAPSEKTVVTWCFNHAEFRAGAWQAGSQVPVLFLDGHVDQLTPQQMADWTQQDGLNWRAYPLP